ncbi:MAG: hypothetical protein Q7S40_24395 [Opitutaceae bacterium]|nr:hypothetical protein [Opitutaceae bacterium]
MLGKKMEKPDFTKQGMLDTLAKLHAAGVPGAHALAERTKAAEAAVRSEPISEQESQNLWTESFAVGFAKDFLGFEILDIEQNGDILSPHRIGNKSCDLLCKDDEGNEIFVETKDNSGDLLRAESSGISGYTPPTQKQVNDWIATKVYQSIKKGANLLIARIPTYSPAFTPLREEDINFEIFRDYTIRNEICVNISIDIPPHFRGIWFFRNGAQVFYKVLRSK